MRATELWGPVGQGWNYTVTNERTVAHGDILLFFCDVTFFYDQCKYSFGPMPCINAVVSVDNDGIQRIDDDATKKAVTDGLSKLFSHLGFSADVYLGQLDSNKYADKKESKYQSKSTRSQSKNKSALLITPKMRQRMFAIARGNGYSDGDVAAIIKRFGYSSTSEIVNSKYNAICRELSRKKSG